MSASVTWVGNTALKRTANYEKFNRGVIEYVERWEGNSADGSWPSYAIGGFISPTVAGVALGSLTLYDIAVESSANKAVSSYVARASNKFDDNKSEWTLELELTSNWIVSTAGKFSVGWFGSPILKKTSWFINAPAVQASGTFETPIPPFSIQVPAIPTLPTGYTWANGTPSYQWLRTGDSMATQGQVYVRTTIWTRFIA